MNEPRERTSDWILEKYVQDEKLEDYCKVFIPNKRMTICKHGIYKLIAPRVLICTNCQQIIIDTQEFDEIADWMHALCRGA
jgi:hypothetical protein